MRKILIIALLFSLVFTSCNNDNPFRVGADQVGPLTKNSKASEIKSLFAQDSVVDQGGSSTLGGAAKTFDVYDKKGAQLLRIITISAQDTATVQTIQIMDPRYKTEKNINLNSTFKDIKDAYTLSKIETLLSSVMVFVNDLNAYFVIDKKELPSALQFDRDLKIEAAQIPDQAKIKYFMVGW